MNGLFFFVGFFNVLVLLFYILATGFLGARLGIFLDGCMDYGHIFDFFRYNAAKKSAIRSGQLALFNIEKEKAKQHGFGSRIQAFDSLYWKLATYDRGFVVWVCIKCMVVRITLFMALLCAIPLLYYYCYEFSTVMAICAVVAYISLSPVVATYFIDR